MNDFQNISQDFYLIKKSNNEFLNSTKMIFNFFDSIIKNMKNNLNNYETSIKKILNLNEIKFSPFFSLFEKIIEIINLINFSSNEFLNKLNKTFLEPFLILTNNLEEFTNNNNSNFKLLSNKLIEQKNNLNFSYSNYLNSYNQFKNNENEYSKFINNENLYKYEIIKINNLIEDSNKNFKTLIEQSNNKKLKTMIILKDFCAKFVNNLSKFDFSEINEKIKNLFNENGIFENLKKNKNIFYNFNEENRFKLENFQDLKNDENNFNFNNNNNNINDFEIIVDDEEFDKNNNKNEKFFIKNLLNKEEFNIDFIKNFIDFIGEKNKIEDEFFYSNFSKFLNKLNLKFKNEIYFFNEKNLIHFSKILNSILTNLNENNLNEKIYFLKIVNLSEKTFSNENFLSFYLSKNNKIFNSKNFWLNLFNFELYENINKIINEKKIYKKILKYEKFIKLFQKNNFFEYFKLNEEKTIFFKNIFNNIFNNLIFKYLKHLIFFKNSLEFCESILNEITSFFLFDENYYKFYLFFIKCFYIKIKFNNNKKKINYYLNHSIFYLNQENYLNLLLLNKNFNKIFFKKIFKIFIYKNLTNSFEFKQKFYNIIFKIDFIKKNYNFNNLLLEYKNLPNKKNIPNSNIIEFDVVRSFILIKNDENIEKLKNILNLINYKFSKIGYSQGMNNLVSYFLELFNYNEEKTFYFIVGIFLFTDYLNLFINDCQNLKMFFFIVEKIIEIYFPNLFFIFNNNSIESGYFSYSLFITLFTFCFSEKIKKSILFIIENFIYDDFKAIFVAIFTVINYYKNDILNIKKEKIVEFIVNKIFTKNFLYDENFNVFVEEYSKNKKIIHKNLIENIKNLFILKNKFKININ